MRPSQRNKLQADIKKAKSDIATWEKVAAKFITGSPPNIKAVNEANKAKQRLAAATENLKFYSDF